MLSRTDRIALFMEGHVTGRAAKMGYGVLRYSPNEVVCVIDSELAGQETGPLTGLPRSVPIVADVNAAAALGANVMVLGIAPPGGAIPAAWYPPIEAAVAAGMSVLNGLHDRLAPRFSNLRPGQWVWDVRTEPEGLPTGTGAAAGLRNRRVLMIGTDMSIGKMTAGLEMYRVARERGVSAEFVATGQIGITVTGRGVPLDAIRLDFASGSIEREVMACADAELVIVEGQGSMAHPASSANLPLLRGSMPTHFVMCHRAGQTTLFSLPEVSIPPMRQLIDLYESVATGAGNFPTPKTVAIALNTAHLDAAAADAACAELEAEHGLPCVDPIRHGPERLVDAVMA